MYVIHSTTRNGSGVIRCRAVYIVRLGVITSPTSQYTSTPRCRFSLYHKYHFPGVIRFRAMHQGITITTNPSTHPEVSYYTLAIYYIYRVFDTIGTRSTVHGHWRLIKSTIDNYLRTASGQRVIHPWSWKSRDVANKSGGIADCIIPLSSSKIQIELTWYKNCSHS